MTHLRPECVQTTFSLLRGDGGDGGSSLLILGRLIVVLDNCSFTATDGGGDSVVEGPLLLRAHAAKVSLHLGAEVLGEGCAGGSEQLVGHLEDHSVLTSGVDGVVEKCLFLLGHAGEVVYHFRNEGPVGSGGGDHGLRHLGRESVAVSHGR